MRGEFPDDVSGAAVGPIFTGHWPTPTPPLYKAASHSVAHLRWLMTNEDRTHSGSRNVVEKFTSHAVQNLYNQNSTPKLAVYDLSGNFMYHFV